MHRHLIVTIVAQLFGARVREQMCRAERVRDWERLTLKQVRRAADTYIGSLDLPRRLRHQRYEAEICRIGYHRKRNAEASRCPIRTRIANYLQMGIIPDSIKCIDQKPLLHKRK